MSATMAGEADSGEAVRERTRWAPGWVLVLGMPAMLLLGLPVIVLVLRGVASGSVLAAVASPAVVDALVLSAITTSLSVVIVLVIGMPLALALARGHVPGGRPGRALIDAAVDLPIVLPPSVAGLALLLVFGRRGLLGEPLAALGVTLPFTTAAVVLAQVFVAAPFFVRSARVGIAGVERALEDAARVDGATEPGVLRWITLPLSAPALTAGLVMGWARALGEFGATIMFAGNIAGRTQTLPLLVYGQFQSDDLDAAIAAAVVLVMAALVALIAVRGLHWGRMLDTRGGA
jgi:molybdate transport system permease protein